MPIPGLAPVAPTSAICLGCGNRMRLDVEKYKNGKVSRLVLYCDTCKYGHEPSMQHISGMPVPYVIPQSRTREIPAVAEPVKEGSGI